MLRILSPLLFTLTLVGCAGLDTARVQPSPKSIDGDFVKMDNAEKLHFPLKRPLLVIKEPKGILACAYINPATCDKTDEACAIVSGVSSYDDMYKAPVVAVSRKAADLGITVGESGESALRKMR